MTPVPRRHGCATYELRIGGQLDRHWSAWFGHFDLNHEADHTTTLTGVVADQAELHGLLAKIRDLGVTLIAVTVVEAPVTPAAGRPAVASAVHRP